MTGHLACTTNETCRLLGVGKGQGRGLRALVEAGVLHPIPWVGGRVRYSLEEIQRVAREGVIPGGVDNCGPRRYVDLVELTGGIEWCNEDRRGQMAICGTCRGEMTTQHACTPGQYVAPDGKAFPVVRFGRERQWLHEGAACGDCGVILGEPHHPGCDVEECPACHGQRISCDCDLEWRPVAELLS